MIIVSRRAAARLVLAGAVLALCAGCGDPGATTCRDFVKMSASDRHALIAKWRHEYTEKQRASTEEFLYSTCSDSNASDPDGRLEDIRP